MLDIHLFGKFRQLAERKGATDNSVIAVDYVAEETLGELLDRLGIDREDLGEVFVDFTVADVSTEITSKDSRISIFPKGMHLLCGGQHLKGHGFIEKKGPAKKSSYW